jgi:radical SAM superfamily enzyme YgiQ (UPF0313 family)
MARVLCINPWIVDFAAYGLWIEPLGLLAVAGVLRQAGHEVALIDCLDRFHPDGPAPQSARDEYGCGRLAKTELPKPPALAHVPRRWGRYGLPVELFESELASQPRPDAVLVTSMMTYWYPGPLEAIRRVKAQWPEVPVALGGVYATLCPDHAREHSGADAVLSGPGELQALQWVNEVTAERHELSCHPEDVLPAHDLRRPQSFVAVQTARGCPFRCPYCAVHQLCPEGFVPRSPERVVEEIVWCVDELGAVDVAFYDDALLFNAARHILPILDGVIQRGLTVRFHTPNGIHARFIHRELAEKVRQAGFVTIRLGLDTVDPRGSLSDLGKINELGFAHAVEVLFDAGYSSHQVAAYTLIGRPGQSVRQVQAIAALAQSLGVPVRTAQFSPVPGTAEFGAAVSAGCIAANADPLLHNNSIYPCADAQQWEALKCEIQERNRALFA